MNRLKPTNQVVVIAVVASIAFAYVSSLFINRYKLTNDGSRRIDTLTGRVWILTPQYREKTKAEVVREYRDKMPYFRNEEEARDFLRTPDKYPDRRERDDDEVYEWVVRTAGEGNPDFLIDKSVTEYLYWERVQEQ